MERSSSITRILGAARAWGSRRYGQEMAAACCAEPVCEADGAIIAEVEIGPAKAAKATSAAPKRVICIVTLDREGRISCVPKDELL